MSAPVFEFHQLTAGYGEAMVLRDVSGAVAPGRVLGVLGRIQKWGTVVHVVVERLDDLSRPLARIGLRRQPGHPPRDIYVRDLRLGSSIKVPPRDFR